MGKPITQSLAEVKKSANHCRFYAENLEKFSQPKRVKTESLKSYVSLEPLGSIFLILPFNFPFWLAFKSGIPIIACGNSLIVRPADTTPMTGLAVEDLFREAGWDNHEYQNIFSDQSKTEDIISQVDGVSFTGSSRAGRVIAQLAGKHLKKNVMELGGMDPFIVTENSDINKAIEMAFRSRISNAGQVCISAKRFIVHESLEQDFIDGLHQKLQGVVIGNPLNESTQMGPLARDDLTDQVEQQVNECLNHGAKLIYGGNRLEGFQNVFQPTLLKVSPDNISFKEEIFGPVFAVTSYSAEQEAISIANNCDYGLGATVICRDINQGERIAKQIKSGSVTVNEIMKSDSRMPSGGCKNSGYGRECARYGFEEFANIKSIYLSKL